jgi:hypothetical protein
MARERYLVGVDVEELKREKPEQAPQTPRSKWQNFWFYHKWKVVTAVVAAIFAGVMIAQFAAKVEPDYFLVIVTKQQLPVNTIEAIRADLAKSAEDVNGDGKIEIRIQNSFFEGGMTPDSLNTAATALTVHMAAGDVLLYAFEPTYYERYALSGLEDGYVFTTPLADGKGVSEDKMYWNWYGSPLQERLQEYDDTLLEMGQEIYTPGNLYFCVRQNTGTADKEGNAEMHASCVKLLETYIRDNTAPAEVGQ